MNRCDICFEENCNGLHNCKCETCDKASKCYRVLHPTIRITTRCTQECSHCCFKCSPKSNRFMSLDKSNEIALFLKSNNIKDINVMGGEFFLNRDWYDILINLAENVDSMRLVTTGDWVNILEECDKLVKLNNKLGSKLWISVSKDRWHTNKNVDKAEEFLAKNRFVYNIGQPENDKEDVIVPIGRSEGDCSFYGLFGCYCHTPKNMYSFLINEDGDIYKCAFGVIDYDNTSHYTDGGFNARFKEFNKKFDKIFIPSCAACIRNARRYKMLDIQKGE